MAYHKPYPSQIPLILHRIWLGPDPMPAIFESYWEKWRELHGNWQFVTWDKEMILDMGLVNRNVWDLITPGRVKPHVPMDVDRAVAVQRADVACYEIVYRRGGVYVDCDMEPLRSIMPIVRSGKRTRPVKCFAGYEDEHYVAKGIFGATIHNLFMERLVENLERRYFLNKGETMNVQTGPYLITDMARRYPELIKLHEPAVFYPHAYSDVREVEPGDYVGSYTVHHWSSRPAS